MDQETSLAWSEQLHEDSLMVSTGEDEFSNFLEFDMNFPDLGERALDDQPRTMPGLPHGLPATSAEQQMVHMNAEPTLQPSDYSQLMATLPMNSVNQGDAQVHAAFTNAPMTSGFLTPEHQQAQQAYQHASASHHQLQTRLQQQHDSHPRPAASRYSRGQLIIPPTPNSVELQGSAVHMSLHSDDNHEIYDHYARMNDEQALYTPLVSPAMTPLEVQFRIPEFAMPGEYFSPLTSPALEAQGSNRGNNNNHHHHHHHHNVYNMGTSNGSQLFQQSSDTTFMESSVEIGGIPSTSAPPATSAPSSPGILRKSRRRPSANVKRAGKQSPSVRPQSWKKGTLNNDELLNTLSEEGNHNKRARASGGSALRYGSTESSGQDSVSPEPISEPLMPPPALPQTKNSPGPALPAPVSRANAAATPATLMRIQRAQHMQNSEGQFSGRAKLVSGESHDATMEDLVLPEAATTSIPRPAKLSRIDKGPNPDAASPIRSASVTPSIEPMSSSIASKTPGSVAPSPRTVPMPSPSGPVGKKTESRASVSRKRQSMSSSQMSPPLRPKLSPNIQPLMRGDNISSEASALFLASKSNYQHILDGTLLPGVSYPQTLAENLSSKRTNHKLAEQGRRNRINNALKEIEALLPPGFANSRLAKDTSTGSQPKGGGGTEKEKASDKTGNQAISKASTVEMAIDYIKALKQELDETKEKLRNAEARLGGKCTQNSDSASASGKQAASSAKLEAGSSQGVMAAAPSANDQLLGNGASLNESSIEGLRTAG